MQVETTWCPSSLTAAGTWQKRGPKHFRLPGIIIHKKKHGRQCHHVPLSGSCPSPGHLLPKKESRNSTVPPRPCGETGTIFRSLKQEPGTL